LPADVLERIVDDVLAIAAIPAPTGDEQQRQAWLRERLRGELDIDAVGNLIWRPGGGDGRPDVLVLAHVATVFGRDLPHRPRRDGESLQGPGIGDNAAAVAVTIAVAESLRDAGVPLEGVVVAFTVGEEGLGDLLGARRACGDLRPHRVVAVEGHGLDHVIVDAVGNVRARVTVDGPGGHSWWDRGTPSATAGLLRLLAELDQPREGAAFNIATLEGGSAVNAIAASATAMVETRSREAGPLDAFAADLQRLEAPTGLELTVRIVGRRPGGPLDPSGDLVRAARRARETLGLPDVLGDGSTDANAALPLGIPAICLGCGRGTGMHTPQETIDAPSLLAGHAQLRLLLEDLVA
jgi:acetylornithine deacetylase/succinyl-diaminopimelate desuccinylase-like protein